MSHRAPIRTIAPSLRSRAGQRGVAALFVTVMLCFAMVLAVAVAHRNVVVEEQRSANELRAASAFEAAEAGLDWALARINDPSRIGADCLPSADAAAVSFRERLVRIDVPSGDLAPRTWMDGGTPVPLQAACVRGADGWTCRCPASGRPVLPASVGSAMAPAFVVELAAVDTTRRRSRAGDRLHAQRCRRDLRGERRRGRRSDGPARSRVGDAAGASRRAGRRADRPGRCRRRRRLARCSQRRRRERRARGSRRRPHRRQRRFASARRRALRSVHRSPATTPRCARCPATASSRAPSAWDTQRGRRNPPRAGSTARPTAPAALGAAIDAGQRLLVIEGDATITGPAAFGSADDPIVLVATGALRLSGDRRAARRRPRRLAGMERHDAGPRVRPRARSSPAPTAATAPSICIRDAAVLARLAIGSGSFVRVNGSWKDFQ